MTSQKSENSGQQDRSTDPQSGRTTGDLRPDEEGPASEGEASEEAPSIDAPIPEIPLEPADIDAILAGDDDDKPLDNRNLDAIIGQADASEGGAGPLEQSSIDTLVSSLASEGKTVLGQPSEPSEPAPPVESTPPAASEAAAPGEGPVSQEMIDALVASGGEAAGLAQEPSAATAPSPPGDGALLSQEDLDAVIQQGQEEEEKRQEAKQAAIDTIGQPETAVPSGPDGPAEEAQPPFDVLKPRKGFFRKKKTPKQAEKPREPGAVTLYIRDNFLKVSASIAAMVVFTLATFTYLYTHQERVPDLEALAALQGADLRRAVQSAQILIKQGDYHGAIKELDGTIAKAQPSAERMDAQFLYLEAAYRALPEHPSERQAERVHAEINDLVESARAHPRAVEALRWKADLYKRVGILHGARDIYEEILASFGTAPMLDEILMDAAKLAMELDKPKKAAAYMQRLLRQFPGSPLAGEAKLRLADAFAAAGDPDDARVLYVRIAQAQTGTPVGAKAFAHLGQLAYDRGGYQEAIEQLETCLEMAITVEGNDRIYLQLAHAYRAAGQLTDARRVLNELIDFFPETDTTPEAFIELSHVLDDLGMRKEAVRLASQTAQRYPRNPAVLENEAKLLESAGDMLSAARSWVAAHEAGADNAGVLLAAARAFHKAGALSDATDTYNRLLETFSRSPQAFEGGIELAETEYEMGKVRKALESLENLATATQGKPQRLPVLITLGTMYQDLGLRERVAEVFGEVAVFTTEPEALAQAATAMIKAGALDEGVAVAKRVDVTKLKPATAYALEMAHGQALLSIDPRRALEKMESAYETYPEHRTPDGDQKLLEVYLATNNSARARALVMSLDAHVRRNQVDAPRLEKAAITWANYLYERGDSRAAADAYALAIEAATPGSPDLPWAKYQRANALLRLSDFEGSVALYDEVAATDAPWAEQADVMADYGRLEQHLRGLPVTAATPEAG